MCLYAKSLKEWKKLPEIVQSEEPISVINKWLKNVTSREIIISMLLFYRSTFRIRGRAPMHLNIPREINVDKTKGMILNNKGYDP